MATLVQTDRRDRIRAGYRPPVAEPLDLTPQTGLLAASNESWDEEGLGNV